MGQVNKQPTPDQNNFVEDFQSGELLISKDKVPIMESTANGRDEVYYKCVKCRIPDSFPKRLKNVIFRDAATQVQLSPNGYIYDRGTFEKVDKNAMGKPFYELNEIEWLKPVESLPIEEKLSELQKENDIYCEREILFENKIKYLESELQAAVNKDVPIEEGKDAIEFGVWLNANDYQSTPHHAKMRSVHKNEGKPIWIKELYQLFKNNQH